MARPKKEKEVKVKEEKVKIKAEPVVHTLTREDHLRIAALNAAVTLVSNSSRVSSFDTIEEVKRISSIFYNNALAV